MKTKIKKWLAGSAAALALTAGAVVAPAAVEAPGSVSEAYSTSMCHWRGAYSASGYYTKYKIVHKNFTAWEEWTNIYNRDGYYAIYMSNAIRVGAINEYEGTYYPTWGKYLGNC